MALILASGSTIRHQLLTNANVAHEVIVPRVDEQMVKDALRAEDTRPRDIADALAELKARKISEKHPADLVIGCDQTLDLNGQLLDKPRDPADALEQLRGMRGGKHSLFSAAVICHEGRAIWRHVGTVRLTMRDASDGYLADYVDRNWEALRHSVGGYQLEGEGVRLFTRVEGDYFHVLGLPLLELLAYLGLRGEIDT